jgi:hypothetical protein
MINYKLATGLTLYIIEHYILMYGGNRIVSKMGSIGLSGTRKLINHIITD